MLIRTSLSVAVVVLAPVAVKAEALKEGGYVRCGKFGCRDVRDGLDPLKRDCAEKTGAIYDPSWRKFQGSPSVLAAWRRCAGVPTPTGPDPARVPCATQAGAVFDYKAMHYTGPPEVMESMRRCLGF